MFNVCVLQAEHHLNVQAILYGRCSVFMPCLLTDEQQADRLALPLVHNTVELDTVLQLNLFSDTNIAIEQIQVLYVINFNIYLDNKCVQIEA